MLIGNKEDSNLYNELYNTLQSVDTILKEIRTNFGEWKTYFGNNEFHEADALKDNRSGLIDKFYEINGAAGTICDNIVAEYEGDQKKVMYDKFKSGFDYELDPYWKDFLGHPLKYCALLTDLIIEETEFTFQQSDSRNLNFIIDNE